MDAKRIKMEGHTVANKPHLDHRQMGLWRPESSWEPPASLPTIPTGALVAVDTETRDEGLSNGRGPGWVHKEGWLCGVSYAWDKGSGYIPVKHPETTCFEYDKVIAWLIDLEKRCTLVFQNATYDLGWTGLQPTKRIHDTHAAAVLVDENRLNYSLDGICKWMEIPGKDETQLREAAAALGVDPKKELWRLPGKYVAPYAIQDAVSTLGAHNRLQTLINQQDLTAAYELECKLIPHVRNMRARGIRINIDRVEQLQKKYRAMVDQQLKMLAPKLSTDHRRIPTVHDVNSPQWLKWQFDEAGLKYPTTGAGNPSFEKEFLERLDHVLPRTVVMVRRLSSSAEKFLGNYILGHTHMGRIHAEINQLRDATEEDGSKGTRSYRFSYSNPPLQQMVRPDPDRADPEHKDYKAGFVDIGTEIRDCFEPEEGEIFGAPDYSQQEYRWIVIYANELKLRGAAEAVRAYQEDEKTDFHNYVRDITGLVRKRAKDCNFAKAFGAGVAKFALMTGMTLDEAEEIMGQYDEKLPFVKLLADKCKNVADKRGYIRLLDGYRARFDQWECWIDKSDWGRARALRQNTLPCDWEEAQRRCSDKEHVWFGKRPRRAFTHKACNREIQGSAAVQTKKALLAQAEAGMLPLLQMHDELGHSVPNARYANDIAEIMRTVVQRAVPFKVDAEFGPTWGKCKVSYEEAVRATMKRGRK